jgi:uncharacterized membrane protein YccC
MVARFVQWLQQHDRGYAALRRAGRTAIVMPGLFALDVEVFHNASMALFSAFGSIALLMFVDFSGRMRNRLEAQAALSVAGAVLICLGTLASRTVWLAVLLMAVVAFVVIFLGVVSAVLVGATTALLLAFILPVATQAPLSAIPDRLAGWGLAAVAAFFAVRLLWPAPARTPLRTNAAAACRALAVRLSNSVEHSEDGQASRGVAPNAPDTLEPVSSLQRQFLATSWRPTGLTASERAIVRLVDEIARLNTAVTELDTDRRPRSLQGFSRAAQHASADVLTTSATLLETRSAPIAPLSTARTALTTAIGEMERRLEQHLSIAENSPGDPALAPADDSPVDRFLRAIEFSFRSREVGYATERIATDVELAITAERRRFFDRVLGHEQGDTSAWASARARITSHLQRHSVWLHNSVRGAVGLALAVLIAEEISVEHSFWVILGTLSVLRSNALNTGQNALRAVVGTLIGFIVGAVIVEPVGTNGTLLWLLLPLALLVAGFAPTAISFAAGQAAFTLAIVILFNILEPAGWRVGLVRLEDVAIGTAVSAGVALLFWPRGAAAELGAAMHDAYTTSVEYLARATSGKERSSTHTRALQPADDGERAAAASRRLDDAFRTYLSERGAKPAPLSDIATLVTGVSIVHFSADAIVDLFDHGKSNDEEWGVARERLADVSQSIVEWYDEFATRFDGEHSSAELSPQANTEGQVVSAVREQLARTKESDLAEAVRILWTADLLAAVQRLEASVINASRAAGALWTPPRLRLRGDRRRVTQPVS